MRFTVHSKPGAKVAEVTEISGKELRVAIPARAEGGKANEKLIEILAEYLDVPKSTIKIVSGHTSRTKIVETT